MLLTILPPVNNSYKPKPSPIADRSIKPQHFNKEQNLGKEPDLTLAFDNPLLPLADEPWSKENLESWLNSTIFALSPDSKSYWQDRSIPDLISHYFGSNEFFNLHNLANKLKKIIDLSPDTKLLQRAITLAQLRVPDLKTARSLHPSSLIQNLHLTEPSLIGDAQWSTGKAKFLAVTLMVDLPNKGFIRLHSYPGANSESAVLQDGEDHSHRSNGLVWITRGGLVNQMSSYEIKNFETGESIFHNDTSKNYSAGLVNSGKSVEVNVNSRHFYKTGECYGFPAGQLHRVANFKPTATLFYFTETKTPINQEIIYPSDYNHLAKDPSERKIGLTSQHIIEEMQAIEKFARADSNPT
jgi:hypothetical protein